jgi:pyridinium-3,5-biscarboxylic acid mononucleotide synthase
MEATIRALLEAVRAGEVTPDEGLARLRHLPFEDLGFAKVDHHRRLRRGLPEVILAQGKTTAQVVTIAGRMIEHGEDVLVTRAAEDVARALLDAHPGGEWNELGRTVAWRSPDAAPRRPGILVVSAGTSDLPVAEEAVVTAELFGNDVDRLYDVGVAGIHRLLGQTDKLNAANVIVCVAGMEGALASVVGGLAEVPVIAVPTSIGYGASFGGIAALLAMLNSCASGVTVVNIDNGFGAGYAAAVINRQATEGRGAGARDAAGASGGAADGAAERKGAS